MKASEFLEFLNAVIEDMGKDGMPKGGLDDDEPEEVQYESHGDEAHCACLAVCDGLCGDEEEETVDFEYERVVFAPPATVVIWKDGSKTVVKCSENDTYSKEAGLALCFMKKALGNTSGALNKVLHKEKVDD